MARLDTAAKRDLLALFGQSAGDLLDGWFESDPIKASFGFDAIVGSYASPYSAGTGYVLLHHSIGEVNAVKGNWGHAIGCRRLLCRRTRRDARSRVLMEV